MRIFALANNGSLRWQKQNQGRFRYVFTIGLTLKKATDR